MIDNQDGHGEIDELRSCQAPVARTARILPELRSAQPWCGEPENADSGRQ